MTCSRGSSGGPVCRRNARIARDWLSTCRLMGRRLPQLSPEQRTALLPMLQAQQLKLAELLHQAGVVTAVN
ncbi:hypothetical protein [Streptomyces auratus]|uniref:Uncharacterized protein n=1 Tax=Streptomyces auratus AGR0001 TaxID=1160718 RepID=A0A8B1NW92_9ACTN|nr:hypothetical protein [Streptomyces auratus]QTZ94560.1 hypothetical protein SU9_026490 [Streptomyces auratus AGR0001]